MNQELSLGERSLTEMEELISNGIIRRQLQVVERTERKRNVDQCKLVKPQTVHGRRSAGVHAVKDRLERVARGDIKAVVRQIIFVISRLTAMQSTDNMRQ